MGLNNFFTINFPYGIRRNSNNEWTAFNREYKPLGFNDTFKEFKFEKYPIFTKYAKFNINKIATLIKDDISNIHLDSDGNIERIFFYNDATNPSNFPEYWADYFKIIKELSKLKRINN